MKTDVLYQIDEDPWRVVEEPFPDFGNSVEKLQFFLNFAVLAPSSHNSQPWLFRLLGNEVELYADRTRSLHVVDPTDRELIVSCGAALYHLELSMKHYGYLGGTEILPDSGDADLLARVRLGFLNESSVEERLMFHAIPKRRTNRQPFREDPVPEALLRRLQEHAQMEGAWLDVVRSEDVRFKLAELIGEADRKQWANKRFRLELAAWVHPNRSASRDGIPGYAQGLNDLLSCAGPLVIRTFDLGEGQAARDQEIARFSPAIVVIGTETDRPRDWIATGRALARILLRARVEDTWASFLNQPIELPEMRAELAMLLGRKTSPQLVLRLGLGSDVSPTPRRSVGEVLI